MRKFILSLAALVTLGSGTALAGPPRYQQQVQYQAQRAQKVQIAWSGTWYQGTVLKQSGQNYLVSYDGYSSQWNEWVGPERLRFQGNPVYYAPQQRNQQQYQQQQYQQRNQQQYQQQQYQQRYEQQQYQQRYEQQQYQQQYQAPQYKR